jgi:hypothetical protein
MAMSSTEGSFMAIDPASTSYQGIIGHYEGNGMISIEMPKIINCLGGSVNNACPTLDRLDELDEFTSNRNRRFMPCYRHLQSKDNESLLRDSVCCDFIRGFKPINQYWGFIMKFGHFDFPLLLSNQEIIYL